jgi:hypothetical protein
VVQYIETISTSTSRLPIDTDRSASRDISDRARLRDQDISAQLSGHFLVWLKIIFSQPIQPRILVGIDESDLYRLEIDNCPGRGKDILLC